MVEKSVEPHSKVGAQEILSQLLASRQTARNQKSHPNKGPSTRQQTDDASEDLSDINDAEVAGYLNNKKEFLLKKIIWEAMNREHLKGRQQKDTTKKKKTDPAKKTARTRRTADTENKKTLSSKINFEAMEKLFESDEAIPKRRRLEGLDSDHSEKRELQQLYEGLPSESQSFEEETNGDGSKNNDEYGNEDEYNEDECGNEEQYYGGLDLQNEDQEDEYDFDENYD